MKRFFILLSSLFCTTVCADTINLHWWMNNQTYATTTCEIGNDVLLPTTPTKRGHIFRGWQAEHFDRGTFANWRNVPTNTTFYSQDINSNKTPLNCDYIIISNTSDYAYSFKSFTSYKVKSSWNVYINNTLLKNNGTTVIDDFTFYYEENYGLTCDSIMVINGTQYQPGAVYEGYRAFSQSGQDTPITIYVDDGPVKYNGTWKFVYDGVWEVDGKNGWKPVEQIISE